MLQLITSMNGRPYQDAIEPNVDLMQVPINGAWVCWISVPYYALSLSLSLSLCVCVCILDSPLPHGYLCSPTFVT
jgi:hypothetical protein